MNEKIGRISLQNAKRRSRESMGGVEIPDENSSMIICGMLSSKV